MIRKSLIPVLLATLTSACTQDAPQEKVTSKSLDLSIPEETPSTVNASSIAETPKPLLPNLLGRKNQSRIELDGRVIMDKQAPLTSPVAEGLEVQVKSTF